MSLNILTSLPQEVATKLSVFQLNSTTQALLGLADKGGDPENFIPGMALILATASAGGALLYFGIDTAIRVYRGKNRKK